MGIVRAFTGAIGGTFADQWKDIITAGRFDELTAVSPGVLQQTNAGRGSNFLGSEGVISNGSKIFVPENAAAYIFSQSGIEAVITEAGGYEYQDGQESVFNGDSVGTSIFAQAKDRIGFGGQTSDQKRIAFVNLREIRGLKFGTRGPLVYNDLFYEADLEILAFGSFAVKVVDADKFIRNFVPPNVISYSFLDPQARAQISSEFLQSLIDALNTLSTEYRISQIASQAEELAVRICADSSNAGTWIERFGFKVVTVAIENIEFTPESRELVKEYSSNRMNLKAYEGVSRNTSDVGAQQKIAQGVQDHGLGDGGGLVFGMGLAQGVSPQTASPVNRQSAMSFDEQIEAVKKLKELLDAGVLSEQEFELKKREVMGL
jgi:membrane protease subunit (stomatin/prohibitin family)